MYWKVATLRMVLRGGVRVQSGRTAVSFCMRPPRRGECSGASHWPVRCDSVTGQGVFEYAVPCEISKPVVCLRGRFIARERTVGCSLGHYIFMCYKNPCIKIYKR